MFRDKIFLVTDADGSHFPLTTDDIVRILSIILMPVGTDERDTDTSLTFGRVVSVDRGRGVLLRRDVNPDFEATHVRVSLDDIDEMNTVAGGLVSMTFPPKWSMTNKWKIDDWIKAERVSA